MKILILMPMDEQHVYAAAGIYKALTHENKDITFAIPTFMDYLINGKIVGNWIMAMFDALLSCKKLCEAADKTGENLIIIGNAPREFKFDAIFNFQEIDEALPYNDNFLNKVKTIVAEEENLSAMVNNLYDANDSKLALKDCIATADFINDYINTDVAIDKIKDKYRHIIKDFDNLDKRIREDK